MSRGKIVDLKDLARLTAEAKTGGKAVIHCHGVFDLLHIGHIRYFKQAKDMGDLLVVTVTPDRYVDKGPHRPAFQESLRLEAVASVYCVDYVALNEQPTAEETIRLLKPDIYVKGSEFKGITTDMTGKIGLEEKVVSEVGAKLAFTEDIVFSSTHLINTYFSVYPKDITEYLQLFRKRHDTGEVQGAIDRMSSLKVMVIGDVIIDEYVYCGAIGMSSKDPVLAVKYQSEDRFAGGVLAVANHVANFAGTVELVTILGSENSYEEFIRANMNPKVTTHFFTAKGISTVCKRRILEGYSLNKLIELYMMDEIGPSEEVTKAMCVLLQERMAEFDVILVADFGHGALPKPVVDVLCKGAPFLAVNTQANAGNRGFNTISRYPRADYACIAEHEMRLEARDSQGELRPMIESVRERLGAKYMAVTRGRGGCVVSSADDEFVAVPAFAGKVVDRVGAGDAFLAVTAMAASQDVTPEVLGFLGNVTGAEAVEIVGNDKAIDKLKVKKHIVSLMK